jgi:hypothetical protein
MLVKAVYVAQKGAESSTHSNRNCRKYIFQSPPDLWQALVLGAVTIASLALNVLFILPAVNMSIWALRYDATNWVDRRWRIVARFGEKW